MSQKVGVQTKRLAFIILAGLTISAQGELVHRYKFNGNLEDSKGGFSGTATWDTTYLEAPVYTKDIPKGRVKGGGTKSIELGMNKGTKKSGFQLSTYVLRSGKGSYCFWMKADSVSVDDYLLAAAESGPTAVVFEQAVKVAFADDEHQLKPIKTDVWNLVVVSWDNAAGKAFFYLNDEAPVEIDFKPGSIQPQEIRIGSWNQGDNAEHMENQFNGKLYELQFYDTMLDAKDVKTLYKKPGSVIK